MARRSFRFEPLLRYREQIVELRQQELALEERALQAQMGRLAQMRREVQLVARRIGDWQQRTKLGCELIVSGLGHLEYLRGQEQVEQARLAEMRRRVERAREALTRAMQEQRTLERLKERHMAELHQEELRRESSILDEIGVIQYHRSTEGKEEG